MSVPKKTFDANYDAIDWGAKRLNSRKFFKSYGSNVGPRSRRYLPDQAKVKRGFAAQRKWQSEYDSISRECAQTNAELRADGYDTCGN